MGKKKQNIMSQRVADKYLSFGKESSEEKQYEVALFWKNPFENPKKQRWIPKARATVPRLSDFLKMPSVQKEFKGRERGGMWFLTDRKREDVLVYREPEKRHPDFGLGMGGEEHLYKIEINGKPLNKQIYDQVVKWIGSHI